MTAVNVEAAIEALTTEAVTSDEISKMDINRGDHLHLILDFYEKHGKPLTEDADSQNGQNDEGQISDGNSEETGFSD